MLRSLWKTNIKGWSGSFFKGITFGALSSSLFLICLVSGIFLSLFYDPVHPYASIIRMLLYNPWACFWRNLHYWSAQFFMAAVIIHFWGYLRSRNFTVLKRGLWFRLVLAIVTAFLVMFTGFLIKGDHDSLQASLIFRKLLDSIPFGGKLLSAAILGSRNSYILPYVHHIATTSIILIIVIREHARKLWTGSSMVLLCLLPLAIMSIFLIPPLHDGLDPVVKGPWYFVGLQEILHWTARPVLVWYGILFFFILIVALRELPPFSAGIARKMLLIMGVSYILLSLTGVFFRGVNWQLTVPGRGENQSHYAWTANVMANPAGSLIIHDSLRGKESCLHCHDRFTGLRGDHDPVKIGCYSCHGGNKFSLDKDVAHRNMRLIPGNMADAVNSCGSTSCHPDIVPRVEQSLMTRLSGLIAVDRWVFGETKTPDDGADIKNVKNTPAGIHMKNLCLSCHLGGIKAAAGPVEEKSRGGGCLACHLNYDRESFKQHHQYQKNNNQAIMRDFVHPSIDINVSNDHCFGCHSRSGRISLNYEGWAEILGGELREKGKQYRQLQDQRWLVFVEEDIHHEKGMSCSDCHTARDVMGDTKKYLHKEDAVAIRCTDCHPAGAFRTIRPEMLDYEAIKLRRLWGIDTGTVFVCTDIRQDVLLGARVKGDSIGFTGRFSHSVFPLRRQSRQCTQGKVHASLHCSACHAGWAPRCLGCHTTFNRQEQGVDLLILSTTRGRWEEATAEFRYGLPSLGVKESKNGKIVIPVVPGMIMTIDNGTQRSFQRLFAPLEPHTTQQKGRSCKSCHNDALALGLGEGTLEYTVTGNRGKWFFTPAYIKSKDDGLPMDAWTGFLKDSSGRTSTRKNVRPFTANEQMKILRPGACLCCHEGDSRVMVMSLDSFDKILKMAGTDCLLPDF